MSPYCSNRKQFYSSGLRSTDAARFGFNGMEKDNEFKGTGISYTTEFRQNDTRLSRWLTIDPITQSWQSPYTSLDNNPIVFIDPFGDKIYFDSRKDYRAFKKQSKKDGKWSEIKATYKGRNSLRNLKVLETNDVNNTLATAKIQEQIKAGNNTVDNFDYFYFNSHSSGLNESRVGGQNEAPIEFAVSAPFVPGFTNFLDPSDGLSQLQNAANTYLNTPGATQISITIGTNAFNLDQPSGNPDGRPLRQLLWDRAQTVRSLLIQMGVPAVAFPTNWLQFAPGTTIGTTIRVR